MSISVATWNTQWATANSARGPRISATLDAAGADVVVVTEGERDLLPSTGSVVDAGNDWGYGPKPSRRKVIVWSRFPLTCDGVGNSGAALGRLAVATAATPHGPVRIIGVCIPWRDAHVTTGRCDAQPWSEHLDYLDRLEELLSRLDDEVPTIIAGDFNQRIPRERQPVRVAERLSGVLADWAIHTAGALPNGPHIDHIAINGRLILESVRDWAALDHLGSLSDHAGVACRLGITGAPVMEAEQGSPSDTRPVEQRLAATPAPDRDPAPDRAPAHYSARGSTAAVIHGSLTPELRTEIEDVLRRSGDGLSHGATFRLQEQGLTEAEIAAERDVSVSTTRVFLRSLDALLSGELPKAKSLALTNSYVYRELLNHPRSDSLDSYVKAKLRELRKINPEISFAPLQTRSHQYGKGKRM